MYENQLEFKILNSRRSFVCVFAGVVPEPEGQVAQTGEDGGGKTGPERLRALNDDRFA